jgi:hypothetical protein
MFDSKTPLSSRIADTMDLLLDFATLGEYGLEPVGRTPEPCEVPRRTQIRDLRGPGRNEMRMRGVRGASGASSARGAAWQRHASRATAE